MSIGLPSARDAQTRYLNYVDMVKDGQKAVVDAVELWTSAFDEALGKPAGRLPLEPLAPKELVETGFDLVERVIAAQKKVVFALFDIAV